MNLCEVYLFIQRDRLLFPLVGLTDIVKEAGAELAGVGCVIEKSFQEGRGLLEHGRWHRDIFGKCSPDRFPAE
jgi:hypothetical protein